MREPDGSAYRVSKTVRQLVVFSEQDVTRDPPFSRLDLVSCRNLLIYMGSALQRRLISLFHYALSPGGTLFLVTSETIGEASDLFGTLHRESRLYRRLDDLANTRRLGMGEFLPRRAEQEGHRLPAGLPATEHKQKLRELTERTLLQHSGQVGALINERGDILYLHGRTGKYLEPAPGEAAINILKMARDGLRRELTTALHKAVAAKEPVFHPGLRVKSNGGFTGADLAVLPVAASPGATAAAELYLVALEEVPVALPEPPQGAEVGASVEGGGAADSDVRIEGLRRELQAKEEYLQATNEELETSNEELKSSNEEMQSINEELQSTNEELETSKEELQSLNEELATVNAELQAKVAALSQANNDLNNLIAGTDIGTVFVDHQLRIQRFTPMVTQVLNLIRTDAGRPVGHIASNLVDYDRLVADVQAVLDSLVPMEVEVQTRAGTWFLLRILPYRTLQNVIEGAAIIFFDITESKRAQAAQQEIEAKYRMVFDATPHCSIFQDGAGRITEANPAAERLLGLSLAQLRALDPPDIPWKAVREVGSGAAVDPDPAMLALQTGQEVRGVVVGVRLPRRAGVTTLLVNAVPQLREGEAAPYQVYTTFDDITDQEPAGPAEVAAQPMGPGLPGGAR